MKKRKLTKEALYLFLLILALFFITCKKEEITYKEQFNLEKFKLKQFDLYNPILHTFRLDPSEREEHPNYFNFDAYFDDKGTLRYSFFRSDSYGFLQEFSYDSSERVSEVKVYPILAGFIDKNASEIINEYFYWNGNLKAIKDNINGELILLELGSATLYRGIISSSTDDFEIEVIDPEKYFIKFLH